MHNSTYARIILKADRKSKTGIEIKRGKSGGA
jgi:hypothetical protein